MQRENLNSLEDLTAPSGYQIRTYQKGDENSWLTIIKSSFGHGYDLWHPNIDEIINSKEFDPHSLFFIVYHDQPVGTVCALQRSHERRTIGYVHMMGVMPEHQGKGLGRVLVLCTLHYFREKGLQETVLDTEDHRLPAIKTYFDLGFEPVYLKPDHKRRWDQVFANLNRFHKK